MPIIQASRVPNHPAQGGNRRVCELSFLWSTKIKLRPGCTWAAAGLERMAGLQNDASRPQRTSTRACYVSMHRAPVLSRHSVRSLQHRQANVFALLSAPARPEPLLVHSMAADLLAVQGANGSADAATLSTAQQAAAADAGAATGAAMLSRDGSNGASTASDDASPGLMQNFLRLLSTVALHSMPLASLMQ